MFSVLIWAPVVDRNRTDGLSEQAVAARSFPWRSLTVAIGQNSRWDGNRSACGTIKLWHGVVNNSENSHARSGHWYVHARVLCGVFYAVLAQFAPECRLASVPCSPCGSKARRELAENSPFIIDRYRAATISLDYYGDSVLNSVSDIVAMMLGFAVCAPRQCGYRSLRWLSWRCCWRW